MMNSRERILNNVKANQPDLTQLPEDLHTTSAWRSLDALEGFRTVLQGIGGAVIEVSDYEEICRYIQKEFEGFKRVISTVEELNRVTHGEWQNQLPHSYEDVDLAVIKAHFGVAENAALWITEDLMHQRVVPFICQSLAVVVERTKILHTMHDAYELIGNSDYGFGAFIAGPSKTADIEQSLVLGAHGPKSMTVFVIGG